MSEEYDEYGDLIENETEEDEIDEMRRLIMEAETNEVWLEEQVDDETEVDPVELEKRKTLLPFTDTNLMPDINRKTGQKE